jgi:hypothetical protein
MKELPDFPKCSPFLPCYGKFDLTTYIQGASDYEIMCNLVQLYNTMSNGYTKITDVVTKNNEIIENVLTYLKAQEGFNNNIRVYNTFTDALNDTGLIENMVVITLGYDEINDGGAGTYLMHAPYNSPYHIKYNETLDFVYTFTNIVNFKALGGSNNIDNNSPLLQSLLDFDKSGNNWIFFPTGNYKFADPITLTKTRIIKLMGQCSGQLRKVLSNDGIPATGATSALTYTGNSNSTFITSNCVFAEVKDLFFLSDSCYFHIVPIATRPFTPYNPYQLITSKENVNAIDFHTAERATFNNVHIEGFSGVGVYTRGTWTLTGMHIRACGTGIYQLASDTELFNSYIVGCKIGVDVIGVFFAYGVFIDQCCENGFFSNREQATLHFVGIIDHMGYAGINFINALDINLFARIGRCGMYYAGYTGQITDYNELQKNSFISIQKLDNGNMHLFSYKRSITDSNNSNEYDLPNLYFNGKIWSNVAIFGLNTQDNYQIKSSAFISITNSTLYSCNGASTLNT